MLSDFSTDSHVFGRAIASSVIILIGSALFYCSYNLFFHPLRKYPGTLLSHTTRLQYVWNVLRGTHHTWVRKLHEKHGDVVRIAPNELSYTTPQAWKDIFGHRVGGKGNLQKDPNTYNDENHSIGDGVPSIVDADDPTHSRMRRVFAHAFSDKALKMQEPLFMTYVNLLIKKLHEKLKDEPQHAIDMVKMYNFTTFDVMGDLTFGEPLQLLEKSEYVPWITFIFGSIKAGTILKVTEIYLPLLSKMLQHAVPKSFKEQRDAHLNFSKARVQRRLEKKSAKPDIWNLVLKQEESKSLSVGEMNSNATVFMIAGTETTATLLSGVTYHLLANPEKLKTLVDEIRGAFASDEEMSMGRLAELKYLHACLEEALRMYPPVPIGLQRITPPQGATICDQYVAGNTVVYVSHYAAYRQERNFRKPDAFVPERWLDDPEFADDQRAVLQPFSFGPRSCLGRNMAYHEMRLILGKVLYNFDLTLAAESGDWAEQGVWSLWEKKPLMVHLTPRGS